MKISPLMSVMQAAARKAAKPLKRDFGEVENLQTSRKGPGDFVTASDRRVEDILFTELSKARPGYGFLGEEREEVIGTDATHRWIVDPIDGTTNFIHGLPHFAINIALQRDGAIVAGVTYNPISEEMFWAEKGHGAFVQDLNGLQRRLRVSTRRDLADSLLVTGWPHMGRPGLKTFLQETEILAPKVAGLRRTGSAALDLAYTAAGRFDAYWERDLKIWDIAAGMILVRESGGTVLEPDGGEQVLEHGHIAVGNEVLLKTLIRTLNPAYAS